MPPLFGSTPSRDGWFFRLSTPFNAGTSSRFELLNLSAERGGWEKMDKEGRIVVFGDSLRNLGKKLARRQFALRI